MLRQIKKDYNIRLADGRKAILSAVQLSDGKFEVMLLADDANMDEIDTVQCESEPDALAFFDHMRERIPADLLCIFAGGFERSSDLRLGARRHGRWRNLQL